VLLLAETAKIADVGLARIMQHTLGIGNTATGAPAGTFAYAAPEMLLGERWHEKADIYSFGAYLYRYTYAESHNHYLFVVASTVRPPAGGALARKGGHQQLWCVPLQLHMCCARVP
jgi:serine/threonine protein kinase